MLIFLNKKLVNIIILQYNFAMLLQQICVKHGAGVKVEAE